MNTKLIGFLSLLLAIPCLALAQPKHRFRSIYILQIPSNPETVTESLFINPSDIENLEFMKNPDVEKRFGKLDKKTLVMMISPKSHVKLMNLTDFFIAYKVPSNSQQFPIIVDGITTTKDNFLIQEEFVQSVQVVDNSIRITSRLSAARQIE